MIDFNGVFKSFGARDIFSDASFRVEKGEHVGVVGPNGSGKSTLFSMLTDEMSPDRGSVVVPKKARLGFLRQQLDFFKDSEPLVDFVSSAGGELPKIQGRMQELEKELEAPAHPEKNALLNELGHLQTVFEHLGGYEMKHRAAAALAGLGFKQEDLEKHMGEFSGGWQMRACMARTILGEPDILLLDEPSNYLDTPAVEWLQKRLRTYEGTLMLISHDRFLLNSLTNVTLEVDHAKITRYPGNYNYYVREREERRKHALAAAANLDREKERLERNIDRFRYKASKASQVQSWIKMLDKMDDIDVPDDLHFRGTIRIPPPPHSGLETVRVENIGHSYDGEHIILSCVNVRIEHGEKVAIVGYNGAGKTTLLKILAGRMTPTEGTRTPGYQVIVGYQAQEFAELLPPEMSVYDVVRAAANANVTIQRTREILGAFGFSGEDIEKQCRVLSGGEKIRLCFARIFVNPPNFLVLDEPTTHLDISAREALQRSLHDYEGTVCMVSHDIEFIRGTAKTIIEVRGHHATRFGGDYDYYRAQVEERERRELKAAQSIPAQDADSCSDAQKQQDFNSKEKRRERAAKRQEMSKDKKRLEREVGKLEGVIESLENEKKSLLDEFAAPPPDFDYAGKQKHLSELESAITKATRNWEFEAAKLELLMNEYNAIGEN